VPEGQSVEEWVDSAPHLTGFAFLIDGRWSENGKMGWWGAVHDEKQGWAETFLKLVDQVPDDWYLTVIDCHI